MCYCYLLHKNIPFRLKALPPVCIEMRVEWQCYICHETLIKLYKQSGSVLSVLLYFTLTKVSQ